MSVKYTTPAQHKSNLRNVYGTFAIEGMTISKDTRSNLDRIGSGQGVLCCLDRSLIFIQKLLDHITVNAALSPDDANHFILQCIPFVVLEVEFTLGA